MKALQDSGHKPALVVWTPGAESLLEPAVLERFEIICTWYAKDTEELLALRGKSVVATLTTHLAAKWMDLLPNLRLIVVPGAGYEGIDVAAARTKGIVVANAGSAHSADVADYAIALTMASLHRVPEMHERVLNGSWQTGGKSIRRRAMSTQRFGILGLGNIGKAIAERLGVFGGEIAWWGPRQKIVSWTRMGSPLELAKWCSVLIVAARGDAVGLVNCDVIDAVGRDGLIVNISRGSVVNEDYLIEALKEGRLGAAALDVFSSEPTSPSRWKGVPNTVLSPHVGGVSDHALEQLRQAATKNLLSVLDGNAVVHDVGSEQ